MVGVGWFAAIFVGALAGWIAEKYMQREHNLLQNIALGIGGALVFNFILTSIFGSTLGGWIGQLFVGAVGACLLIWLGQVMRNRG